MLGFFAEVDAELPPDESVEVVVIGGAAVMFLVPDRVTDDVDVISEDMPQVLSDAAARVARRHGLRPKWINDAARVGLPHLPANYAAVYSGERLIVHRADPKYVLATKLFAGRAVDVEDAVPLALAAGITTEEAARGSDPVTCRTGPVLWPDGAPRPAPWPANLPAGAGYRDELGRCSRGTTPV